MTPFEICALQEALDSAPIGTEALDMSMLFIRRIQPMRGYRCAPREVTTIERQPGGPRALDESVTYSTELLPEYRVTRTFESSLLLLWRGWTVLDMHGPWAEGEPWFAAIGNPIGMSAGQRTHGSGLTPALALCAAVVRVVAADMLDSDTAAP